MVAMYDNGEWKGSEDECDNNQNGEKRSVNMQPSRRQFLNTVGVASGASFIGFTGVDKATASNVNNYWMDSTREEFTQTDGPVEYEGNLGSSLAYFDSYVDYDPGQNRIFFELRNESEAVTRINESGSWEDDYAVQNCQISVTDIYGAEIYAEATGDNIGIRPAPNGGTDPTYPTIVEEVAELAIGEIHDYLNYAETAGSVVAAFLSDNPISGDTDQITWEWSYSGARADVSYHSKFESMFYEGDEGQIMVEDSFDYHSASTTTLKTGWWVYYDGTKLLEPNEQTYGGEVSDEPSSLEEAIENSPNPPENPEEWTYVPVPEGHSPKRIKTSSLPEHSAVRKNARGEYVMKTKAPLWVRQT